MSVPVVYVAYHHRPMSVGLFFRMAFQQAGCRVFSMGPVTPDVYGLDWARGELIEPDVVTGIRPYGSTEILAQAAAARLPMPDLVVMIDQYDQFFLVGNVVEAHPVHGTYVAVENWNAEQRSRYDLRQGWDEYHMISHSDQAPLPENSEWMLFGADPFVHPFWGLVRDKLTCQIGSTYEPRPQVWNELRRILDEAPNVGTGEYSKALIESQRTIFGKCASYRAMAEAYNRSETALSSSNVDFIPMRAPEAFALGSILLSDDVSSMRRAYGAPWPENQHGIWVAHDRTPQGIIDQISMIKIDREGIRSRALAFVAGGHWYYHRAIQVLKRASLLPLSLGRMTVRAGS